MAGPGEGTPTHPHDHAVRKRAPYRSGAPRARSAEAPLQIPETHRIDLAALAEDYVDIYTQYLVSLQGKGRKELVEIARWVQNPQQRRGLFSFMRPCRPTTFRNSRYMPPRNGFA